ncbi:MAG TPA: hypothetical protein VGD42_03260 [Lysobacter sp.]
MACRIVNLHSQPLRIDLRGGELLLLAPNERSRVLREELLYDNQHIGEWERAGWLRLVPARMDDLQAEEAAQSQPASDEKRTGKPKPRKATVAKTTGKKSATKKTHPR